MEEGTVCYEGVFRLKARQDNPGPILYELLQIPSDSLNRFVTLSGASCSFIARSEVEGPR
jgi:hypothetical protein